MLTRVPASNSRPGAQKASRWIGTFSREIVGRIVASGLVIGLALFHVQLLWQRLASWTLLEPLVALRWGGAVLLALAFAYLKRAGISVIWGHKALVLWLLVLLLHAVVPAGVGQVQPLAEPVLLALSLWGLGLIAAVGGLVLRNGILASRSAWLQAGRRPLLSSFDPGFFEPLSPRPPPV